MGHALVFDSGVGGLSVVAELRKLMPDLYITYVADDEFRPYGEKTEAQLVARLPGLIKTLSLAIQPDIAVIACNTASTTALEEIRAILDIPVIGVVPAIKPAAQKSTTKTIAVLGTPGTVERKYVDRLISDFGNGCQVVLHGSTDLVNMAEKKLSGQTVDVQSLKAEIMPMFSAKGGSDIDMVVLACTHFPLLLDEFRSAVPHKVEWIDSGAAIARRTKTILASLCLLPAPDYPQTAFLIGGQDCGARGNFFTRYGFEKVVTL